MKRAYSDREGGQSAGKRRHSDENEPTPQLHTIFYGEVKTQIPTLTAKISCLSVVILMNFTIDIIPIDQQ